jgi:hypothetical protein
MPRPSKTLWAALYTGHPLQGGYEFLGNGYRRVPIGTLLPIYRDFWWGFINMTDVVFPVAIEDWGCMKYIGLCDHPSEGILKRWASYDSPFFDIPDVSFDADIPGEFGFDIGITISKGEQFCVRSGEIALFAGEYFDEEFESIPIVSTIGDTVIIGTEYIV